MPQFDGTAALQTMISPAEVLDGQEDHIAASQ
jgi:hypothetical protein